MFLCFGIIHMNTMIITVYLQNDSSDLVLEFTLKVFLCFSFVFTAFPTRLENCLFFNNFLKNLFQMTHERVKKKNSQRASELNLAVMLLCIVFFFLVCHFPRILLNVHEFFMLEDMISCGPGKCLFTPQK